VKDASVVRFVAITKVKKVGVKEKRNGGSLSEIGEQDDD